MSTDILRPIGRFEFVALIAAINTINSAAIDVMLPALPNMGAAFHVANINDRSLVLTVFVLGLGLPQLIAGPIVDRFGRRGPLLAGLLLYSAAAFAALAAPSFAWLLALRFIQGAGSAAAAVATQAAIRDRYSGRAMAEVSSMIWSTFMIVPIIAPGVGQLILLGGNWQLIFIFMGVVGLVFGGWTYYRLPESLSLADRRPLSFGGLREGFVTVISHRLAFLYALAGTFMFGAILGMVNSAQPIYVGIYGLGALFPLAFAVAPITAGIAFLANARLVARIGMRRLSHGSLFAYIAVTGLWLAVALTGYMPLWLFIAGMALAMLTQSLAWGSMPAMMMEPLGEVAGTASAVFGALSTVGAAGLGYVVAQTFNGTSTPFIASLFLFGLVVLGCVLAAESGRLFGASKPAPDAAAPPA